MNALLRGCHVAECSSSLSGDGDGVAVCDVRFKRTGTGKIVRSKAFKQHILTSKARSRKRKLRGTVEVSDGDYKKLDRMIPRK